MVVLSTRVSYTTQLSGSTFDSGELYNTTEWWYFHSRELYNTTELTRELSDVWFPNDDVVTQGQQYNIGEKPTVMLFLCLYSHIN